MISQETQDKFYKENGIAITDAISHIQKWTSEKNFQSAENGIKELKNFLSDSDEVKNLEKELFEMKNSQSSEAKAVVNSEKSPEGNSNSTISDEEKSEKFMAALSYVSYLVIVPLLLKKDSQLCQHHGKQGLVIVIIFFILGTIANFLPFIGSAMVAMISLAQIAIAIYGGMKAYKGQMWVAPIVGEAAAKIKL